MHEFANFYLEIAKVALRKDGAKAQAATRNVLYKTVENGLRLLAPFMPFLTEELWQRLPRCRGQHDLVGGGLGRGVVLRTSLPFPSLPLYSKRSTRPPFMWRPIL